MARKREISLFTDIQSDEEFDKFLQQNKLLVLDVYQNLFGPCMSLQSTLERKKISLEDSDSLQLATCNADKIEKLKRFHRKSYPTIIFCRKQKVIDILYGVNIRKISITIDKYMEIYRDPRNDTLLPLYEFNELLPFEKQAIEDELRKESERIRAEKEAEQMEKFSKLDITIELMNKNASDMGITLFMPHVAKYGFRKTYENAKWLSLVNRSERMIQLTPEMKETLNYNLENPIDEKILEHIYGKDIFSVLWYTDPRNSITSVLNEFVKLVTEPQEREVEGEESIWETILHPLVIDLKEVENNDDEVPGSIYSGMTETEKIGSIESMNSQQPEKEVVLKNEDLQSIQRPSQLFNVASSVFGNNSRKSSMNKLIIPAVWTPANQNGNAIFMHEFFRSQFESFLPQIIEPDPPHLCIVFPAKIHNQVLETCDEYPKDLLNYGFFEGDDFDDFKLLCKSVESYENLMPNGKEKIILKVAKRTSLLALELMKFSPLYISRNTVEGQEECSMLFACDDLAANDEEMP